MGNDNFTAAPSGSFATQDGHINIAANKQEQWEAMAEVIGAPELKTDPRFQERDERKKNRKALTPLVEEKLKQKPTAALGRGAQRPRRPLGRHPLPEGRPRAAAGASTARSSHPVKVDDEIGEVKLFGLTAQLSKTPGAITSPPPRLGAHTEEVLVGLGYTKEDVAA